MGLELGPLDSVLGPYGPRARPVGFCAGARMGPEPRWAIRSFTRMPHGKKTILVVDDEPNIVLGLRDALEFEGFRVISSGKGQEAIALARSESPDAIILDLM